MRVSEPCGSSILARPTKEVSGRKRYSGKIVDTHAPKELSCLAAARLICLLALSLAHTQPDTASMLLSRLTIVVALACIANLAHGIDLEIGGAPYLGTLTPSTPLEFAVCRSLVRSLVYTRPPALL